MSGNDVLVIERHGEIEHAILNRGDMGNALNGELVDALVTYFEGLREREDVRIVVLKARGKHFCVGLDLNPGTFGEQDSSPQSVWRVQRRIARIYLAMRKCPQPIIALVQGAACGGGFSLALAADIRIASDNVKMNAAYIRVGYTGCDMGSSYFLPRLVGASVAAEFLMTGRFIHAERALAINLVSAVTTESEMEQIAAGYMQDMLLTSPMGLRLTKDGLNISIDAPSLEAAMALEDRHQSLLALTEDAREAALAFMEKRAPQYHNR